MDKCLHILPMSTLSGAEKMTLSLCKNLKEYEPIVICGGDPLKEVFEENEITTYSTSFDYKNIISNMKFIRSVIKQHNIKIIHAHDNNASIIVYIVKRIYGLEVNIISHIHSCYPWIKNKKSINKKIDGFFRPRYNHNILCGKIVQNFYKQNTDYFKEETSSILSNAVDISELCITSYSEFEDLRTKYNIPENKIVLGFIGRICYIKGIIPFVKEFAKKVDEFKDTVVLLVGTGDQFEEVKELIKVLNLEEYFILTGFQKDIYKFYPLIDIFFLPSLYEGLPMVILEAMASRTPVISMDVGGISEVIVDNYSGFLVEEKNYAQFISKIIELKNDATLRRKFSSNAFEIISNNFDIQKYCENVEKIYKNFI